MTVVRSDTFTRANVSNGWGTATDGNTWTLQSGSSSTLSVAADEGTFTSTASSNFLTLGAALSGADAEGLVRVQLGDNTSNTAGILLRWTDANNHWLCRINSAAGVANVMVKVSGTYTTLSPTFTFTPSTSLHYWIRFRCQGTTIEFKIWQDGTGEPGAWTESYTSSSQNVAGAVGLYGFVNSPSTNLYDNFSVDDLVSNVALSGTLTPTDTLAGGLTGAPVTLSGTLSATDTLAGNLTDGTGIASLSVSTQLQSWSGGPTGSPGNETDITSLDGTQSGFRVGMIPGYGAATITSFYEVDGGVVSPNQTSLTTSIPDGHVHLLEQSPGGNFDGSEGHPYTLNENAPAGTSFRRSYTGSYGPDTNGLNWAVTTVIYPGDPGFIAYRFDMINPGGTAIALASSDSLEFALIGGLQQNDTTWTPTNGGYGTLAGGNTVGWPASLTVVDADYVYITPSAASNHTLGVATIKQKKASTYTLPWGNVQLQYLQNTSRLKVKLQGDVALTVPANSTQTFYLLNVFRRNLVAADIRAMASDYQNPGTPSGPFTAFSYDERAFVFASSANVVITTLDLAAATLRYKPIIKLTGWTSSAAPLVEWAGVALVAGTDYQWVYDSANQALYVQLYFDVIPAGNTPMAGQKANAQLTVSPPQAILAGTLTPTDTAVATMSPPAATLVGALAPTETAAATLTPPAIALVGPLQPNDTLVAALTPPAVTLAGTLLATDTVASSGLIPPAAAISGTVVATDTLVGTLVPPAATLVGTLAAADTLAGVLAPVDISLTGTLGAFDTLAGSFAPAAVLSGTLTPTDTLAGTLAINAVALAGTLAPSDILAGALVTPNAALAGTLAPSDTLAGSLVGAAVALAGAIAALDTAAAALTAPAVALAGALAPGDTATGQIQTPNATLSGVLTLSDTLAGTLTPPAVTLAGAIAALDSVVGALSGAAVALSGSLAASDTVAATLTAPAVALAGTLAPTDTLAGGLSALVPLAGILSATDTLSGQMGTPISGTLTPTDTATAVLSPPSVTLSGALVASDTLAGALSGLIPLGGALLASDTLAGTITAGKRQNNESMTTDNVLRALSVVLPSGTQQGAGGTVSINDDSPMVVNVASWPMLLIMEGPQDTVRIAPRTLQKKLTIMIFYLREWGDGANAQATNDAIWEEINADLELMIANLADNPTLTCVLPGAGAASRNCLEIVSVEPSPRTQKVIDYTTYRQPCVQRMLTIKANLPPYIGIS